VAVYIKRIYIKEKKQKERDGLLSISMASSSLGAFILFSTILLSASLAPAANAPTTCYVLDGTHNSDAGFRCDNSTTGHSACCGIGAICYSNGVCQQMNEGIQDFLRVGCTDPTWQDAACLDQCTICKSYLSFKSRYNTEQDLMMVFPRCEKQYSGHQVLWRDD
jgi:hypothetical protein